MLLVKEIVNETYTNASGKELYLALKDNFLANQPFELSFEGISSTSSSFLNSSFGLLIEEFSFETFISLMKIKNVTKSEAEIIRKFISGVQNLSGKVDNEIIRK